MNSDISRTRSLPRSFNMLWPQFGKPISHAPGLDLAMASAFLHGDPERWTLDRRSQFSAVLGLKSYLVSLIGRLQVCDRQQLSPRSRYLGLRRTYWGTVVRYDRDNHTAATGPSQCSVVPQAQDKMCLPNLVDLGRSYRQFCPFGSSSDRRWNG